MARGMAANEGITSQAQTKAFDENADRIGLGKSERAKERGRFVWDAKAGKLVRPWEVDAPALAVNAPVLAGRFYENTGTVDGVDIGSRRKRRDYMARAGVVDAHEAHEDGARNAKATAAATDRARRESLTRELERIVLMPQARHDKELKQRERERRERGEQGL